MLGVGWDLVVLIALRAFPESHRGRARATAEEVPGRDEAEKLSLCILHSSSGSVCCSILRRCQSGPVHFDPKSLPPNILDIA
jgi:hypothetical protein